MTEENHKKSKFKQFVGMPKKITELVEGESDRGAILILAAYLEEILGLIVGGACVTDLDGEKIQEFRGPAGGFDLKIQLCKALALIHPDEATSLNFVRKIRNCAAHFDNKRGFDVLFDSQQTIDHVNNLAQSVNLVLDSRQPNYVRHIFTASIRLLATRLYCRALAIHRPSPLKTLKETANEFRSEQKSTETGKLLEEIEQEAENGNMEPIMALFESMGDALKAQLAQDENGAVPK